MMITVLRGGDHIESHDGHFDGDGDTGLGGACCLGGPASAEARDWLEVAHWSVDPQAPAPERWNRAEMPKRPQLRVD